MRTLTLGVALCLLISCRTKADLEDGLWTGSLSPMNHPEAATPITYDVAHEDDVLTIRLLGPDSLLIPTRGVTLASDTLFFTFDEPEEGVALECALAAAEAGSYAGRCEDAEGKWAYFTMVPPKR